MWQGRKSQLGPFFLTLPPLVHVHTGLGVFRGTLPLGQPDLVEYTR